MIEQRVNTIEFDLIAHLHQQRDFSERTFGPGTRTAGLLDHIRKELNEIEADPADISEWIDVVLLAFDGAWRAGFTPEQIAYALHAKQQKNENRTWPDWRTAEPGKAIEHVRIYLSGPMTGYENFNYPAFNAEAARLRDMGYDVVNPAELNPSTMPWHECLRNDIAQLVRCDAIVLMDGWEKSNGAHLEMHVAHRVGMDIILTRDLKEAA